VDLGTLVNTQAHMKRMRECPAVQRALDQENALYSPKRS
jgi:hypothetical protein